MGESTWSARRWSSTEHPDPCRIVVRDLPTRSRGLSWSRCSGTGRGTAFRGDESPTPQGPAYGDDAVVAWRPPIPGKAGCSAIGRSVTRHVSHAALGRTGGERNIAAVEVRARVVDCCRCSLRRGLFGPFALHVSTSSCRSRFPKCTVSTQRQRMGTGWDETMRRHLLVAGILLTVDKSSAAEGRSGVPYRRRQPQSWRADQCQRTISRIELACRGSRGARS
jgi:hypothetical protein